MCAPHVLEAAMSREADFHPDHLLRQAARRAAEAPLSRAAPDAAAELERARRGSVHAPIGDLSTGDLQLLEARR